ncbi:MAG: PIN domain-containing protein [Candidatus Aquicultor sp.]|nr:PIN domain-containing protein [Candidatus Aquicultor sp.]
MSKINKKRPIYVLDTNVLLYNPKAIYAFPDADVVIPDTVLGELDKVKTSRADRELRYRSRQISRILFDLSEKGKLTDGISFGKNSIVRVMSFDPSKGTPESFSAKNSDDRILTIVYQVKQDTNGRPVTIVTNDLNMLLKAQALGVNVEHPGEEFAYGGVKRAFFKVKAQKKALTAIAAIAAVVAGIAFFPQFADYLGLQQGTNIPEGPPQLVQGFQDYQNNVKALEAQRDTYLGIIKNSPKDVQALTGLGNTYFNMGQLSQDKDSYQKAIEYYRKALAIDANQNSTRTDMALAYSYLGTTDLAIRELNTVISKDKDFYQAYFNLGVILLKEENDLLNARSNFLKVKEKAPEDSIFYVQADEYLKQVEAQLNSQSKGG